MKFENTQVFNFEGALRGMRNPKNSWAKSDSYYVLNTDKQDPFLQKINVFNAIENDLIPFLETLRVMYNKTQNKQIWKELIRWLPESWLQTRTVTLNYENLLAICRHRRHHKLNEWSGADKVDLPNFISWARSLPYAKEFIFYDEETQQ